MICGNKIKLRALEDRDMTKLRYWRNHPKLMKYHLSTLPIAEIEQRHWYENYANTERLVVFIIENEAAQDIGYVLIKDIDHKNRNAEVGIHLDPEFHGKGYGKDAFFTLIRFCFYELNLHRVFLQVFTFNERAIKMYKEMGFNTEGHLREAYFTQNTYYNIVVMSILADEFAELYPMIEQESLH